MQVIPLRDSEVGLIGQDGWTPWVDGSLVPHYEPLAPEWECYRDTGSTFIWRHSTHCFGHPIGSCSRKLAKYETVYCYQCGTAYAGEMERQSKIDKREQMVSIAIEDGVLPRWFKDWQRLLLTDSQMSCMAAIESNEAVNVWISGQKGRGKTELALHVLNSYVDRCRTVAYATPQTMYESRSNKHLYNALTTVQLLVLDDIDKGTLNQVAIMHLHGVLSERHEARLRTIVTSEHPFGKVSALFSEACGKIAGGSTLDRLRLPKHDILQVELSGENMRRA